MKKALFYTTDGSTVTCGLCQHRCLVRPGRRGRCGVRENRDGELYSLVYGKVAAEQTDPVEKKPLFHFLPGSLTFSLATVGCNFSCLHCQNHTLSQTAPENSRFRVREPEEIVGIARTCGCRSISYTYVEPTVFFEFAYDCSVAAHRAGLKNIFVSNGFISSDALSMLVPVLDGINIDIKSCENSFYQDVCGGGPYGFDHILDTVRQFYARGVWVEVTTLLIPGVNDSDDELRSIARYLATISRDIPWHVSAFRPAYRMMDRLSTSASSLLRARMLGFAEGLRYVYTGNVRNEGGEDTACPECRKQLVHRVGFRVVENLLSSEFCPFCGSKIAGYW